MKSNEVFGKYNIDGRNDSLGIPKEADPHPCESVRAWRLLRDLTVLGQLFFPTDRDHCVWVYIHVTVRTDLCFLLDRRSEEN